MEIKVDYLVFFLVLRMQSIFKIKQTKNIKSRLDNFSFFTDLVPSSLLE